MFRIKGLKDLTNKQLEAILLLVTGTLFVVSFVEAFAQYLLLATVLISPVAFGYGMGCLFDYFDTSAEYRVMFNNKSHMRLAIVVSLLVGVLAKHLATQMPIVPYSPIINDFFMVVAPKIVFFLWGLIMAGLGYWLAWKGFKNHQSVPFGG